MKINLNYNKIPERLKAIPNWVAHTEKKVPINVKTRNTAQANNPNTWSDFDTTVRYAKQRGLGIGFQFGTANKLSGIVGIDIDHCRDPETGQLNDLAKDVISMFSRCYVEISPKRRVIQHQVSKLYIHIVMLLPY